jgi:hypothetical protein
MSLISSTTRTTFGWDDIMAAILQFQHREKSHVKDLVAGHTATILLFTGVRFERIDFAALNTAPDDNQLLSKASPKRRAN